MKRVTHIIREYTKYDKKFPAVRFPAIRFCGKFGNRQDFLRYDSMKDEVYSENTYATWAFEGETWRVCKTCLKSARRSRTSSYKS